MSGGKVTYRRANLEDLEGILAMSENLYGGIDYIRAYYNIWLQDPRCYSYVAEVDGNVISYHVKRIMDDGKTEYGFGSRTATGYEGLGVMNNVKSLAFKKIFSDYPSVKEMLVVSLDNPGFQRALKKTTEMRPIAVWVYHMFVPEIRHLRAVEEILSLVPTVLESNEMSESTTYQQAISRLPDIQDCLLNLGVSYITTRMFPEFPYKLTTHSLRDCLVANDVIITTDTETSKILAVSLHHSFINNISGSVSAFKFYGREITHFKQHIEIFLKHALNLVESKETGKIGFLINFPTHVDEDAVEQYLTRFLGNRVQLNGGLTHIYITAQSRL